MALLIAIGDDSLSIRKEACPSALDMFQPAEFDAARLAGSDGQERELLRMAGRDRDRPLSIRRKSACAAIS